MTFYAIILARGGSQSIPKKNILPINNIPLIEYTIRQCLEADIKSVYTSSDDDEILEIAKNAGSKIIKRPDKYARNISSSEEAWIHAIENIKEINNTKDWIFAPQVTSPIRHVSDINNALNLASSNSYDSILSVVEFDDFFIWANKSGFLTPINHNYQSRQRRQEIKDKTYLENGSFYLFKPEGIIKNENRLHGKIGFSIMQKYKMFQIDEIEDIEIAEFFIKKYQI